MLQVLSWIHCAARLDVNFVQFRNLWRLLDYRVVGLFVFFFLFHLILCPSPLQIILFLGFVPLHPWFFELYGIGGFNPFHGIWVPSCFPKVRSLSHSDSVIPLQIYYSVLSWRSTGCFIPSHRKMWWLVNMNS